MAYLKKELFDVASRLQSIVTDYSLKYLLSTRSQWLLCSSFISPSVFVVLNYVLEKNIFFKLTWKVT